MPLFRFSRFIAFIFFAVVLYNAVTCRLEPNGRASVIAFDAKGYYAYLPAVFIYQDLKWDFVEKEWGKYYPGPHYYDYRDFNGHRVNKYYCGVAVMQSPFFFSAMLYSYLFGYPVDGFSVPFHISVSIASCFYFALGIYFLARLLILFGIRRAIVAGILVLIAFGTNLFYYAVDEPGMSHVYSFCAISGFLLYLKLAMDTIRTRYLVKCAVFFGLVCILRPTNALVILAIPAFAGSWGNLIAHLWAFFRQRTRMVLALLAFFMVFGIQVVLFYLQCGKLFIWSYGGVEQMFLSRPELFNVLFSYRKGLFVYTPLVLVSLFGLYYMAKESVFRAVWLFMLLYSAIYIISCWWLWYYGGSLGMRPFIEYYPFVGLLLGYLLSRPADLKIKILAWSACIFCLYYSGVQMEQYRRGMITYSDMDETRFWAIFMKHPTRYGGYVPPNRSGEEKPNPDRVIRNTIFFNDFDKSPAWDANDLYTADYAYSGAKCTKVDEDHKYSSGIEKSFTELGNSKKLMIQLTCMVYPESLDGDAVLVYVYKHGDEQYNWKGFQIDPRCSKEGAWNRIEIREMLPPPKTDTDHIQVYIFQENGSALYIDDISIEFTEMK
jgi:hypothetical protein